MARDKFIFVCNFLFAIIGICISYRSRDIACMNILSVSSTEIICFHFASQSSPFVAIILLIFMICVIYCERFVFEESHKRCAGIIMPIEIWRHNIIFRSSRCSIAIGLCRRQSLSFNDNRKGEDSLSVEMRLTAECR